MAKITKKNERKRRISIRYTTNRGWCSGRVQDFVAGTWEQWEETSEAHISRFAGPFSLKFHT